MEEYLNIFQADARHIKKEDRKGTVVCNPPYGERMGEREEIERLYQQLGGSFNVADIKLPAETMKYAMCVIAAGPMLVVFPFFQKYFARGLTVGSVKG